MIERVSCIYPDYRKIPLDGGDTLLITNDTLKILTASGKATVFDLDGIEKVVVRIKPEE